MRSYSIVGFLCVIQALAQDSPVPESPVAAAFIDAKITPDIVSEAPDSLLRVYYPTAEICPGVEVAQTQVIATPRFGYEFEEMCNYTLMVVDIDVPSALLPNLRSELYLLICNIPGNDTTTGFTFVPYKAPRAVAGSGDHRYLFLLFLQTEYIDKTSSPLLSLAANRYNFNVEINISRLKLRLKAGNFFTINVPSITNDGYCTA